MQKRILMLATSAFILARGGTAATAQQGPMMQQQAQPQQQQERTPQGAQMPRRGAGDDFDDDKDMRDRAGISDQTESPSVRPAHQPSVQRPPHNPAADQSPQRDAVRNRAICPRAWLPYQCKMSNRSNSCLALRRSMSAWVNLWRND